MSLVIGLPAGSFYTRELSLDWLMVCGLMTFGLAIPGFIRPRVAMLPYRAFNRLAKILAHYAKEFLLLLVFFTMSIAGGKNSSFLKLIPPHDGSSLWVPKGQDTMSDDSLSYGDPPVLLPQRSWYSTFVWWAIRSGNWWMCALLPLLILIALFEKEQEVTTVPESVYTLY